MENTNSKKKALLAIVLAAFLVIVILLTLMAEGWVADNPTPAIPVTAEELDAGKPAPYPIGSTEDQPVRFSLPCGFYRSNQKLTLECDEGRIVYTKDGSDPQKSGKPYNANEGIALKTSDKTASKIYSISACVQYDDGSYSKTVTRSYILGSEIDKRFDCLVFSITIDPDKLYNYEDGIFILGKMRDDYLATKPTKEIQPTDPANWNQRGMAGEREAYVEVFEYDGSCIISQACGLRIFGGWSRANNQKNLRLYARSEYDEVNNRFRYEFFPDALDSNGDKLKSVKKLSLRACANDNGYLFARDDAMSYLAMADDIDAKHSRPAAVFLNGEYYGFAWLQEVFSSDWLDHKYNVEDGEWDILKGCEYMIREDADNDIEKAKSDWELMQSYAYKDLTDDKIFAELESMLDIDNFLAYYALNSYIGNGDWPNNNYKAYRFVSGDTSMAARTDRLDGRWRFMLFDTDFSLGLYGKDFLEKHIYKLLDETYFGLQPENWDLDVHDDGEKYLRSDLLIAMCKRDDIREKFVANVLDMMNWYCSPEKVANMLDEKHILRLHELVEASNAGTCSTWSVAGELDSCKDWIKKRPYSARLQLSQAFPDCYGVDNTFKIITESNPNAIIKISTCRILPDEELAFSGEYFLGMSIPVDCEIANGYKFDYWTVNGEKIYSKELVITDSVYGKTVNIDLAVSPDTAGIDIYEVCYKGGDDYIILKNYSDKALTTKGLTLADDIGKDPYILPTAQIPAGRTLRIICKNYSRNDALGSIECGFSLKEGETLILRNEKGEVVREIYLRDAASGSALRLDHVTNLYEAFTPYPKDRLLDAELPSWGNWGWGDWGGWGGWGW